MFATAWVFFCTTLWIYCFARRIWYAHVVCQPWTITCLSLSSWQWRRQTPFTREGFFRREWWQHQAVKPWVFSEATLMVDKNVAMTMTRYDKMTRYPRPGKIASALCRDDHPINEPSHMHLTTCLLSGYANGTAEHSCLCCCFLLLVLVVTMSAVETGWKCERMCLHDVCNAEKGAHTHRGRGMIMKPLQSAKSSQIMRGKIKQELARCNYMQLCCWWTDYPVSMNHVCVTVRGQY